MPGGGQLFGRTPLEIFDPQERSPAFADGPVLARAGDRHRYESIARDEYDAIRAEVEAGTYEYRVEEGTFDCAGYVDWLAEIGGAGGEARPREHVGASLMLEVLEGGLHTTVQDMGRRGGQALGIPPSGAQDGFALRIANLLVGNPAGGPLVVREDPGPGRPGNDPRPAEAQERWWTTRSRSPAPTAGATVDGEPAPPCWSSFVLRRGQTLACGLARSGARAYFAVHGGIDVPLYRGSRATHVSGGFGGLEGRPLTQGDRLPVGKATATAAKRAGRRLRPDLVPRYAPPMRGARRRRT